MNTAILDQTLELPAVDQIRVRALRIEAPVRHRHVVQKPGHRGVVPGGDVDEYRRARQHRARPGYRGRPVLSQRYRLVEAALRDLARGPGGGGDRSLGHLPHHDPSGAVGGGDQRGPHFHLIKFGNQMLTSVRHRVIREVRGRRGRKQEPVWAHRKLLGAADRADPTFGLAVVAAQLPEADRV